MSLTRSQEVSLFCTFLSCPTSLPEFLLGRVTPYPISYSNIYPDSYPRMCLIPYLSCHLKPYPSHTQACYPELYPSRTRACYPEFYPSRYLSHTRVCYPELYPSPTRTRTRPGYPGLTRALTWPGKILLNHVPDRITFDPITYPALSDFLTRPGNFLLALPEALLTPTL
jgi:hypothetical protein